MRESIGYQDRHTWAGYAEEETEGLLSGPEAKMRLSVNQSSLRKQRVITSNLLDQTSTRFDEWSNTSGSDLESIRIDIGRLGAAARTCTPTTGTNSQGTQSLLLYTNIGSSLSLLTISAIRLTDWQKMDPLNLQIACGVTACTVIVTVIECMHQCSSLRMSLPTLLLLKAFFLTLTVAHLSFSKFLYEQIASAFFISNVFVNLTFALFHQRPANQEKTQATPKKAKHGKAGRYIDVRLLKSQKAALMATQAQAPQDQSMTPTPKGPDTASQNQNLTKSNIDRMMRSSNYGTSQRINQKGSVPNCNQTVKNQSSNEPNGCSSRQHNFNDAKTYKSFEIEYKASDGLSRQRKSMNPMSTLPGLTLETGSSSTRDGSMFDHYEERVKRMKLLKKNGATLCDRKLGSRFLAAPSSTKSMDSEELDVKLNKYDDYEHSSQNQQEQEWQKLQIEFVKQQRSMAQKTIIITL